MALGASAAATANRRVKENAAANGTGDLPKKTAKEQRTAAPRPAKKQLFLFRPLPGQKWVRDKYESTVVQVVVACMIFSNFFISAGEVSYSHSLTLTHNVFTTFHVSAIE
jgi:hypothetical protein